MPVITIKVIKGVVLTSDEQKRELLAKMTDTFISVVGDVARPYTYCIIEETPLFEWSIGGTPMPNLPFLIGPEYAGMHSNANAIMQAFVESQSSGAAGDGGGNGSAAAADPLGSQTPDMGDEAAQAQWAGG